MKKIWILALVFMLALSGTVFAQIDDTKSKATNSEALSVRYDHLACKVDFTNKQIELVEKYIPQANITNISNNKAILITDLDNLKEFVDDSNKTQFDNYTTKAFRPHLQKATEDLIKLKREFKKYNVSNDTKAAFIVDLKNITKEYSNCVSDKEIKMGEVMHDSLKNWDKYWTDIIDKMQKNGLNTTEMETLKAEIEAKNTQLEAILASQNMSQLRKYSEEYRQDQLHYAARFEVGRLKSYRDKLGVEAGKYNMTDNISDINKKIEWADKYSQKNYKYKEGEFNDVWDNIKGANKDMKGISKDILKERQRGNMGKSDENNKNKSLQGKPSNRGDGR